MEHSHKDNMANHSHATGHPHGEMQGHSHGEMNRISFSMKGNKNTYFAQEGVDPLTSAFNKKIAIHPGMGGIPVKKEDATPLLADLLTQERKGNTAAYIHIPFCETHCLYCGFYLAPYTEDRSTTYTDALIEELKQSNEYRFVNSAPIHTVYFGGGTPTALKANDIKRLLLAVRQYLPLTNDCEITIEGRILHFDKEKMAACIEGGANRFSLGVQTFDTEIRTRLGRSCGRDEIISCLQDLKSFDNSSVVIDLIYGLPGQDLQKWQDDLELVPELGLDGVDLYQLNVFSGGRLDKAIQAGKIPPAATIPEQAAFFKAGVERMAKHHIRRLSMTHWGATFRERNLYNILMGRRSQCLPFGAGAGGTLNGHFCFQERDYKVYMERVAKQEKPVSMLMRPNPNAKFDGVLSGQTELGYINIPKLSAVAGQDVRELFEPLFSQWEKVGLVKRDGDWVDFTLAGQFWQINLTQALIDWFSTSTSKEQK